MQASAFVGRVGGLAVALGIGAAAFAGAAPAWAAPADSTTSTADAGTPSTSTPSAGPRSRSGRAPVPAARRAAAAPSVAVKNSTAPAASPAPPIVKPAALRNAGVDDVTVRVGPKPSAAQIVATSPGTTSDEIDSVADEAPDMVPAPQDADADTAPASGVAESVPSPLLGTSPGGPVESALSWAVLAVTRRDQTQGQPGAVASPVVSTGEGVVPSAAVSSNKAPVISNVELSSPSASTGAVTGTVTAGDTAGDALTYKATTSGTKGTVTITTAGVFTYTPTATARHNAAKTGATTATTTDTVTVSVIDAKGAVTTKAVTVTIAPKNTNPTTTKTVGNPNSSTGVVTGKVTGSDADKDTLTYSGSTTTSKGTVTVNASTGAFTYTPTATARHNAAKAGAKSTATTDTFTVTVTDGYGGKVAVPVTVTISPKNAVPVAGTPTVGTPNSSTGVVAGSITATDADKDKLSYTAPATTAKGAVSINASTGAFTYTPTTSARGSVAGTDTFTVTVTDGYGGTVNVPVRVTVAAASTDPTTAKVTYVFNYTKGSQYWTPESKAALQASADALSSYLVVTKPVTITFDVTATNSPDSNTMASTGSDLTSSGSGFFNTIVQNKILTGVDTNGSAADGEIDVNFGIPWAYGDSVDEDQYDFTSTMMHELLHAYGFLPYVDEAGWNTGTTWTEFDRFIVTSGGAKVVNPSTYRFNTAYNTNLTGGAGGLFFNGANAVEAYGGPVPLYTPKPWEAGSSVSHLDDDTFTGSDMQLMNAMADSGLGVRTLSPIELGILEDIGYEVNDDPESASVVLFGLVFLRRRRNR